VWKNSEEVGVDPLLERVEEEGIEIVSRRRMYPANFWFGLRNLLRTAVTRVGLQEKVMGEKK
jgi:hypothetical protein